MCEHVYSLTEMHGGSVLSLSSLNKPDQEVVLRNIKRIERKSFPTQEAFQFDTELKKRNTCLLLVHSALNTANVVGYLVYVRIKRVALLHKVCVANEHRRHGHARAMIEALRDRLSTEACECIQLWVDEARNPAKHLYEACGFTLVRKVPDYYALGRTGLEMVLDLTAY
ncbi:MAG: hypothetical protein M1833_006100 [Piccolia ochrophora]|nr:MAG: hypothetical protein M1833_006100 [Piccolia ochrophora]